MPKHVLNGHSIDPAAWRAMLHNALQRKALRVGLPHALPDADAPLTGHLLGLLFMRPSTRTRLSFEAAMRQLGGQVLVLSGQDMQLKRGETIADTARVTSRYLDALMIRTGAHADIVDFAANATIPIINGLSSDFHPCQMLADVMTLAENFGNVAATTVAWVGDGDNNVCQSWIEAAAIFGFTLHIAAPQGLQPRADIVARAQQAGAVLKFFDIAQQAVRGAHAVVTDTWISMDCADPQKRYALLEPYRVDTALMQQALPQAIFMHCLPAHRGEEVTDAVIDSPQSAVWDEAENRLHAQKAILLYCLGI